MHGKCCGAAKLHYEIMDTILEILLALTFKRQIKSLQDRIFKFKQQMVRTIFFSREKGDSWRVLSSP
jgi:hypothetical protein